MGDSGLINTKNLDKQIIKAEKEAVKYTRVREKLKSIFLETYEYDTVNSFLDLLTKEDGFREEEKDFAEKFRNHYESGNMEVLEIKEFKKMFDRHKDKLEKEEKP